MLFINLATCVAGPRADSQHHPSKSFYSEYKNLNKNCSQIRIENEQKEHPHANNSNCRDVGIIDFLISCRRQDYNIGSVRADYECENLVFEKFVKITLTPLLASLSLLQHVDMDSESEVLGHGISIITLNIGMYLLVPVAMIYGIRKSFL